MTLREDTRGVSIPVTHSMTIAITALLLTGLLLGAGSFLNRQQDTVAREQLAEIGGDLANHVNDVDRLNATGESVDVTVEPEYPRTVAGASYNVDLVPPPSDSDRPGWLILDSSAVSQPVRIPISTDTPVEETGARGESPTVVLRSDGGDHCIGLRGCSP